MSTPLADRIRRFLLDRFPAARQHGLAADALLLENGLLDSLGVLDLVAFLEAEFGITVADDDLVPENFHTLGHIVAFVEAKQGAPSPR